MKFAVICSVFTLSLLFSSESFSQNVPTGLTIPADAANKIIGVKLEDVVNNYSNIVPGFANVEANIKKSPDAFFPAGKIETVHQIFLSEYPEVTPGQVKLSLTAYVKYKDFSNFEKITVSYNNGAKKLSEYSIVQVESINLKDMSFTLTVGLVDRKLIIADLAHDVKFIFPIGVGGFDEGVLNEGRVSLLTPRFYNGFIDQRAVISKREKPRYFDGKPFIRLLKGSNIGSDMTAIGFHTEINDSFVRGFDSHGCMRLRVPDLFALHDLIMDGSAQQTPIVVVYRTDNSFDHPAGKRNKTFKTVVNVGTKESPFFPLDRDNLVQMGYKESGAPMELLVDDARDNYEDLFSYDTELQLKEQNDRRKNECQAKLMAGLIGSKPKDMEKSLDDGKRKDSAKDRIYI
ncbi:MAG: L,D-transpeptidase family protein, partial [Bdellovibrionales bacterium]|nr:L,D-transpeptidase family protein [Bdellovibrionales bacterium]